MRREHPMTVTRVKGLTGVVDDDVDAAMDRDRLLRDLLELIERRGHVEFQDVCAVRLELLDLCKGALASGRDDLVSTFQRRQRELPANARTWQKSAPLGNLRDGERCSRGASNQPDEGRHSCEMDEREGKCALLRKAVKMFF